MRVAINAWFWHSLTTGSGQYSRRLVASLSQIESRLELLLVEPGASWASPSTTRFGHSHYPEPAPTTRAGARSNLAKVWFEQVTFPVACRRLRADVAHVPYWAPPLVAAVPTVVTIHDLIPLLLPEYRGDWLVRLYTALVSRTARKATIALTDSEASRQDILAHLHLPAHRIRAIHLAAGDQFTPIRDGDENEVRAILGLPERYLLYLGGFDVRKNVLAVLSAYRRSEPAIGEKCPLLIAGELPERDTPFAPDPRRLAVELGIEARHVRFLGPVEDRHAPALYRGAVAFIFPSHYEGFGLPPLEAMSCGTPVVGSNGSSMPEVVGEGGLLFAPDDADAMGGAIVRLANDDAFRAGLSRRALTQASRFSWQRTGQKTLEAYRGAVAGRW